MTDEVKVESSKASKRSRPLRFVTATSLFDGHDAAINMIRRLMKWFVLPFKRTQMQ